MQDLLFIVAFEKAFVQSNGSDKDIKLIGKNVSVKDYQSIKNNETIQKNDGNDIVPGYEIKIIDTIKSHDYIQATLIIKNRRTSQTIRQRIKYNNSRYIEIPGTNHCLHCGITQFDGNLSTSTHEEYSKLVAQISELTGTPFRYRPRNTDPEPGND